MYMWDNIVGLLRADRSCHFREGIEDALGRMRFGGGPGGGPGISSSIFLLKGGTDLAGFFFGITTFFFWTRGFGACTVLLGITNLSLSSSDVSRRNLDRGLEMRIVHIASSNWTPWPFGGCWSRANARNATNGGGCAFSGWFFRLHGFQFNWCLSSGLAAMLLKEL